MAKKSKHADLDSNLAQELGLVLGNKTLPLKKVQTLVKHAKGWYFAYCEDNQYYYDTIEAWSGSLGCRVKPTRFLLPALTKHRLENKTYLRWYYHYEDVLYRVQIAKVTELFERFWFQPCDTVLPNTQVLVDTEPMFLRKKPLMHLREPRKPWYDKPLPEEFIEMKKRA